MRIVLSTSNFCRMQMLLVAAMVLVPAVHAQNNNNKTQQVTLVDPTPRAIDPHLLLGDNQQAGTATQQAVEHRNQKRRELTIWAADELVMLSHHLQADVVQPKASPNSPDTVAEAQKIEQLAKNLTMALKAQ